MISSAYESLLTSDFATLSANDSTFGTCDTAIANAKAAGQKTVTLTNGNWTPALINYLRDRKYEVNPQSPQTPQNATIWVVSWSAPRD